MFWGGVLGCVGSPPGGGCLPGRGGGGERKGPKFFFPPRFSPGQENLPGGGEFCLFLPLGKHLGFWALLRGGGAPAGAFQNSGGFGETVVGGGGIGPPPKKGKGGGQVEFHVPSWTGGGLVS